MTSVTYRLTDEVICQPVGDESILLDLKNETYFELNATGTLVINELRANRDLDDISRIISERFSLDYAAAKNDVHALIHELLASGLVTSQ